MPRIPRTEASVRVSYANQPTMSPDALTGPGRALQGLGRAIGGLGADLQAAADAGPSEDERYKANLELVKFTNEQDAAEAARQASFTGDPEGYTAGSVGEFDEKRAELLGRLPQHPKIQQSAMLHTERLRGARHDRAFGFESQRKHGQLITTIDETASMEVGTAQPGNIPQLTAKLRGVDAMIDAAPGLSPAEKGALRDKMTAQSLSRMLEGVPDEDKLDVADKIIKDWTSELAVPGAPGGPPAEALPPGEEKLFQDWKAAGITTFDGTDGTPEEKATHDRYMKWLKGGAEAAPAPAGGGFKPDLRSDLGGPIEFADPPLTRTASRGSRDPSQIKGIVFHQTWGSDNMSGNGSWSNQKNTGAHYYIGKDGKVYNWAGDDVVMRHIQGGRNSSDNKRPDLTDQNAIGIEIMTRPNERPNPKQIAVAAALAKQLSEKYKLDPTKDVYGHGELTRKNYRRSDEAIEVVEALRGGDTRMALGGPGSGADTGEGLKVEATAYSPKKSGKGIEGGYSAKFPGVGDPETWDKKNPNNWPVRTLADVAAGKADYVTVAGDEKLRGKTYTIPEISFVDANGKTQTLKNVKAVVHDTGSAFKDAPEGRFDIAIDRDATEKQMAASHDMWKKAGLRFVPEGTEQAEAPTPLGQRGLTAYAGLTNPEAPNGVKVADASGDTVIPGGPAPGMEVAPIKPTLRPSVRGSVVEKLLQMRPSLVEAKQRALAARIERAEKSAAEGYKLPEAERSVLRDKVTASGDRNLLGRLDAAEAAADYTEKMRQGNLQQVKGEAQRLREELNQGGGTPELIARTKAVEGLAANMEKGLSDDSIGWAEKSGAMPPVEPVTPENFSVETLLARKAVADQIGQRYGMEYRQFFRNGEEKAQIEAAFTKGGDDMVNMLATMYEAFGDDTPKAVAEIAPKHPEAVRAAYLASTGGDPKAVKDIAETILRRKEESYGGAPKFEVTQLTADFETVTGDLFKDDRLRRDEVMTTAKAIYENRVADPAVYEANLFRESVGLALGSRKGSGGLEYGGPMTQDGTDWSAAYSGGNTILIPSNIRKDMWNPLLDGITEKDLVAAGHPMPADSTGKPLPLLRALSYSEFRQVGPNQFALFRKADPYKSKERGGYLMTAAPPKANPDEVSTGDIVENMKAGGGDLFVLDLEKLTPILRERMPSAFWKE